MPSLITRTGTELFYERFGDLNRPVALLIQGLGAQMIGWRVGFCEALAQEGFQVVRFDNRDVGLSTHYPAGAYSLSDMADDTAGLLVALGISQAHVIGQSMGGMIAQELVLRHPAVVRSLTLVYTAPSPRYLTSLVTERLQGPVVHTRGDAVTAYLANEAPCASFAYEQDREALAEIGAQAYERDDDTAGGSRQLDALISSRDRTVALANVTAPTAIVHGDADQLIDVEGSRVLHSAIPDSMLEIFPGMGHELPSALWPQLAALVRINASRADAARSL